MIAQIYLFQNEILCKNGSDLQKVAFDWLNSVNGSPWLFL